MNWPTPRTITGGPESAERKQELGRVNSGGGDLQAAALNWPNPQARDHKGVDRAEFREANSRPLNEVAAHWSTPRASDGEKGGPNMSFGSGGTPLPTQAAHWKTPKVSDLKGADPARSENRSGKRHAGDGLATQASQWQTPSVASATGGQRNRGGDRQGELLLAGQALDVSSSLAPTNGAPGDNYSISDRTLNPQFVEALMVWPTGWSAFACSETVLSRWRAAMRSVISRLPLPSRAPAVQPDLFG